MRLWIDDERVPPAQYTHSAMSSAQAIHLLVLAQQAEQPVELVSFDHDLGEIIDWETQEIRDDTSRRVLAWMVEHDSWPKEIRFHTANPVGREWLVGTALRYAPANVRVVA